MNRPAVFLLALLSLVAWSAAAADSPATQPAKKFEGHTDLLAAVAISPDARLVATGSADNAARIFDTASGKLLHTLKAHTAIIVRLEFSADGARLLTSARDGKVRAWDTRTGDLLAVLDTQSRGHIHGTAFTPDGKRALLGNCGYTLEIWDIDSEKLIRSLEFPHKITAVAVSPDGRRFAVGCFGTDLGGDPVRPQLKEDAATAGLWIYDAATNQPVKKFEGVRADLIHFSADGRYLAYLANQFIYRVDARTLEPVSQFNTREGKTLFDDFSISPDGTKALASFVRETEYVDLEKNTHLLTPPVQSGTVLATAISPDGTWALLAGGGTARNAGSGIHGEPILTFVRLTANSTRHRYPIGLFDPAYPPDRRALITRAKDVHTSWDLATGKQIGQIELKANSQKYVFPFDGGKQLLHVYRNTIQRYDFVTGKKLADVAKTDAFNTLVVAPDAKRVFVAGGLIARRDGQPNVPKNIRVDLLDIESGKTLRTYTGVNVPASALFLSPDATTLLALTDQFQDSRRATLAAWDVDSAKLLWTYNPPPGVKESDHAFAVSPAGQVAVTWSPPVQVLDLKTGKLLTTLESPERVFDIAFDPDAKRIWTWDKQRALNTWDLASGKRLKTTTLGYEGWHENRIIFRDNKPYFLGHTDSYVEEVPLAD
jgi:WD40 repeat protein